MRHTTIPALIGLVAILIGSAATAQTFRDDRWEGTLQLIGSSGQSSQGENGSSIDVDSAVGLAFGAAYNLSEHFAVGFDGTWVEPNYTAVFNTEENGLQTLRHKMTVFNGQFSAIWNVIDGPITPYLQAGIGWTYIDSNVTDGPPTTGCWWDPWWGYICSGFYSTYSDTRFSWGAEAGLRVEFDNDMFLKGGYSRIDIDGPNNGSDPSLSTWRLQVGWMFQ